MVNKKEETFKQLTTDEKLLEKLISSSLVETIRGSRKAPFSFHRPNRVIDLHLQKHISQF